MIAESEETRMIQRPRDNRLLAVLIVNAILLGALCFELAPRNNAVAAMPDMSGIANLPSSNVVVMPAQLSPNTWGCYLLDNTKHSLAVYQYSPGERMLRLMAGRDIQYDAKLTDFNTQPTPADVKDILDRAASAGSAVDPSSNKTR